MVKSGKLLAIESADSAPHRRRVWFSKTGLVLCVIYAVIIALSLWMAFRAGADAKGQFIFLQLPIALQMAGAVALGGRIGFFCT
jgi:hypothetical protein